MQNFSKLVKTAVRFMVNDLSAERAAVLIKVSKGRPRIKGQYGFEGSADLWADDSVKVELLKSAWADDTALIDSDGGCATLCVPIREEGKVRGLLYCDHSDPNGLNDGDKENLIELAREFEERYEELKSATTQAKLRQTDSTPWVVAAVVLALVLIILWSSLA